MAIFSFGCLNWHEEPNQISPGTGSHMAPEKAERFLRVFSGALRFGLGLLCSPGRWGINVPFFFYLLTDIFGCLVSVF